jgi:hypothetical protein
MDGEGAQTSEMSAEVDSGNLTAEEVRRLRELLEWHIRSKKRKRKNREERRAFLRRRKKWRKIPAGMGSSGEAKGNSEGLSGQTPLGRRNRTSPPSWRRSSSPGPTAAYRSSLLGREPWYTGGPTLAAG